jgi:hypothetical protein
MKLFVLGRSFGHPAYRGTDRDDPDYQDHLNRSHPANQAFLRYIHNSPHGTGPVEDPEVACDLIRQFQRLEPSQSFELVEAVTGIDHPESGGALLGYDVTERVARSILTHGLWYPGAPEGYPYQHRPEPPECRLFHLYFAPLLNEHILFADKAAADFCRECVVWFDELSLDYFDMLPDGVIVVGLYLVDPTVFER